MNSRDELLSFLDSHPLHELDISYYRLKVLSKTNAVNYAKHACSLLLKNENSYPVGIVKGNRLMALAIAVFRKEDTDVFKKRIGSIEWLTIDRSLSAAEKENCILQLLQECRRNWSGLFDVITMLIDFDEYDVLEILQKNGARIYGGNYTWVCPMNKINEIIFSTKSLENVSFLQTKEIPMLIECIKQSYSTYRSHYHADSGLNSSLSTEVYVAHIKKHLSNAVVVKNSNGDIVGFSTINPHQSVNNYFGKNIVAEIAYSGVVPSARGSRAYELTLIRGIEFFKNQGFSHIVFGCSANNYVVQSIWMNLGDFRPRRFCYRIHWWL